MSLLNLNVLIMITYLLTSFKKLRRSYLSSLIIIIFSYDKIKIKAFGRVWWISDKKRTEVKVQTTRLIELIVNIADLWGYISQIKRTMEEIKLSKYGFGELCRDQNWTVSFSCKKSKLSENKKWIFVLLIKNTLFHFHYLRS